MAKAKSESSHVAAIVSDPAAPPDSILIGGYPGKSPYDGYDRLYLTPDLSFWIDIPKDDVLHEAPVPGDPLGAVYMWIRQGSHLLYKGQKPPATEPASDAGEAAAS